MIMNKLNKAEQEQVKEILDTEDSVIGTLRTMTPTDLAITITALQKLNGWFEQSKMEASERGLSEGDVDRLAIDDIDKYE